MLAKDTLPSGVGNPSSVKRRSLARWADHGVFWGMNIGLVGFVIGLIQEEAILKRVFTPIMGLSLLVAVAVYAARLRAASMKRGLPGATASP